MTRSDSTVYIVDDDASVREGMEDLLSSFGFNVIAFGSAAEYFASSRAETSACLILDVKLPGMDGFELQRQLADGRHPPIIFMTGRRDIPSSVRALKAGAVDFLIKPFEEDQLLNAINSALRRHQAARE
jgi:FixJ family two-component response regulator